MTVTAIYLLLILGNHGYYRLEGTYLDKTACEAKAEDLNTGFDFKPSEEWAQWEARCLPFSGKAPSGLSNFADSPPESKLRERDGQ